MDKMTMRVLVLAITLGFLILSPWAVHAQSPLQPTQIQVGAPAQSSPGESLTVQAVLADSQGRPISGATVYFTTQATFLKGNSDVVLAQAVTNANGQAIAQFVDDFSVGITLNAEFRGDAQYASSQASAEIAVAGGGQVYVEHVGVDIPGFNVPPLGAPMASLGPLQGLAGFVQNLWPAMNGWPVAAVLLLVWSMYLVAVRFVIRVAALGNKPEELPAFDSRRSS